MPARPKHRAGIVDAAIALFRRQGFAQTGLNEIVERSGAPKGSLYHYFPEGKASIAAASVEEAGERVARTVQEVARTAPDTAALLRGHAALLAKWMEKSGFQDGCPITTVLLELAPRDGAVTAAGRRAYELRVATVAAKLEADGFPADRAARLAVLCTSALQGALIQSRVERDGAPILTTADELARLLEAEAPGARAGKPAKGKAEKSEPR